IALGELGGGAEWEPPEPAAPSSAPAAPPAPDVVDEVLALGLPLTRSRELVVDDFERRYVRRILDLHGGDVARAAAASGIARRYFQLLRARHAPRERGGK